MPLKVNGQDFKEIEKFIAQYMPQGKNKSVTFVLCNAQPYQVLGSKGMMSKIGGEYSIPTSDTVMIDGRECILQYYKTSKKAMGKHGVEEMLEPSYIHLMKHKLIFDAGKNQSLFYFMLKNSKNEANAINTGEVPVFRFLQPAESAVKTVKNKSLEVRAINEIDKLRETNKKHLKALYEAAGYSDFDDLVGRDITDKDWDSVLAPLYKLAEVNPQKMMDMINDASLDIAAKVTQALTQGVIKYEGNKFIWEDDVNVSEKKRTICSVPAGKQDNESAAEWFGEWLKSEGSVIGEITVQLAIKSTAQK